MAEQREIIQKDLLGNPIERKIPRITQVVPRGQSTLDGLMEKLNNPGIEVELVREKETAVNRRESKRRPWEKLIVNRGTRDEFTLLGRYYTPDPGVEVWSAPAERRDASPKLTIEQGNIIFQIKDSDVWENGVRWTTAVVLERTEKGETPRIKGHGDMRWRDIQKE